MTTERQLGDGSTDQQNQQQQAGVIARAPNAPHEAETPRREAESKAARKITDWASI